MLKRLRPSEPALATIRDTGGVQPRINPVAVAAALGAQHPVTKLDNALSPLTLRAVREELSARLQSSGGRPALAGTQRRAKIPLGNKEWLELEALAAAISTPGFTPTAGQVASVLLSLGVDSVKCRLEKSDSKTRPLLVRELVSRTASHRLSRHGKSE